MILEDPIKEINKLKYLNNVAMKSRYDMLFINKYNSDKGIKPFQSHYYRNYPSPCRDDDLLAYKLKASNESIKSYLNHIQLVTDSIENSHIIKNLDLIDQTSAMKFKVNKSIEPKQSLGFVITQQRTTIDTHQSKKPFKMSNDKRQNKVSIYSIDIKSNKPHSLRKVKNNKTKFPKIKIEKKINKCVFPRETTPILCTEPLRENNTIDRKHSTEPNLLCDDNSNVNYPKVLIPSYPIQKGEKRMIRLSKLLNKNEMIIDDVIPSVTKSKLLRKRIKVKQPKSDYIQYTQATEPINDDGKLAPTQAFTTINNNNNNNYKKYTYYDNFLLSKEEGVYPYPKHCILKNYYYKKNYKGLMKTNQNYKFLEDKISKTFEKMNNNIVDTIEDHKHVEDLY